MSQIPVSHLCLWNMQVPCYSAKVSVAMFYYDHFYQLTVCLGLLIPLLKDNGMILYDPILIATNPSCRLIKRILVSLPVGFPILLLSFIPTSLPKDSTTAAHYLLNPQKCPALNQLPIFSNLSE